MNSMKYSYKPNYFFFAHKLVLFLKDYLIKHPTEQQTTFNLQTIYDIFSHDLASSTTNLEGILNIADEYVFETEDGLLPLISKHSVNLKNHVLSLEFTPQALASLLSGRSLVNPKAA
ncbi:MULTISPECIES: hypothetical protein [Acinetobacter]|uniref:Uncharacterized protein n=2 Tax=Acinetobacter TaxID=469 RepID=A0A0R0RK87_ACIPI|nr:MULTISPECIES: hypothetical protein [Acinetobacter]EXS25012.1 hypothetical protein J658_0852 [Acinetobacter baumannii 573719]MDC5519138.1 hypothetical protein [Acinetobacter baumannii]KRI50925.1 hypothetical protein APC53_13010 [Acinetobacter pittii]MBJ8470973.1 hypothetical protein [Acinetobacter pittii]MBJ8500834.1 hypothetical protein [Acinetobacter pittii]